MATYEARFMTLTGPFRVDHTGTFSSLDDAVHAARTYAEDAGFTDPKLVADEEDPYSGGYRYTARTPGGRAGRNVAFIDLIGGDE